MYNRKIKLGAGKKRSKGVTPPGPSNWGPRIALAEKEKALCDSHDVNGTASKHLFVTKQSNTNTSRNHPIPFRLHRNGNLPLPPLPPSKQGSSSDRKKISVSSASASSHTGSSSLGGNYVYNYWRKSSSGSSSSKSFFLVPPNARSMYGYSGSTYAAGTSSGSGDTVSTPLTLIIPKVAEKDEFGDQDQDSLPSTQTYRSSTDEDENNDHKTESKTRKDKLGSRITRHRNGQKQSLRSQPEQELANHAVNMGVLKLSTTKPEIHHHYLQKGSLENEGRKRMSLCNYDRRHFSTISDLRNVCSTKNKSNSIGAATLSLAQGIAMVYVPMESLPRSKSAAVLNASLEDPDLSKLIRGENENGKDETIEQFLLSSRNNDDEVLSDEEDKDSLLGSFDSLMFQPKNSDLEPDNNGRISSPSLSSLSSITPPQLHSPLILEAKAKSIDTSAENMKTKHNEHQPPTTNAHHHHCPLPPKQPSLPKLTTKLKFNDNMFANIVKRNKTLQSGPSSIVEPPSASQRERNIRSAVEKLENMIRSASTSPSPSKRADDDDDGTSTDKGTKTSKRVTLTLPQPQPNKTITREEQVLLNLKNDSDFEADACAYSSTFLTCGHVHKEDNYSTLSSSTQTDGPSSSSSQASPTMNTTCPSSSGEHSPSSEHNRSVLQQLKELSILIGNNNDQDGEGNTHDKTPDQNQAQESTAADFSRKISGSTDISADSGKGSGSGTSSEPVTDSSPKSSPDSLECKTSQNRRDQNGVSSPCAFMSDCNECLLNRFKNPETSSELCGKSTGSGSRSLRRQSSYKKSMPSKVVRQKSSRLTKASASKTRQKRHGKHLILEYCECSQCRGYNLQHQAKPKPSKLAATSLPASQITSLVTNGRRFSTGNINSNTSSVKLNRSVAFRNSSRANFLKSLSKSSSTTSPTDANLTTSLFTIEEEENQSVSSNIPKNDFQMQFECGTMRESQPKWWMMADPLVSGWSDLESLYSLNMKSEFPIPIDGECQACWQELSEIKRISNNPHNTVDRTKRMFIWLNKRPKELEAPWWEAKKQASIRWLVTKGLVQVPKGCLLDPFKESKKPSKPTKYRLREEVMKGLVTGKLYSLALTNLYSKLLLGGKGLSAPHDLRHWEIIKILSRRGVYVAQPSDMKLTEGTLRRKPIRIAAHIALIEAIMALYSKEILAKERMLTTLHTFGCTVRPETNSPEQLVIAWINAAVMTLKSYIMSTTNHNLNPETENKWMQLPKVGDIRDLCDGIGICSLFAMYCSNDLKLLDISVPEPGETLTIYDSISNHTIVQKLCEQFFPETIYHLCVTDFLYIHGYMKQNILCFLVDLFIHFEVNPIVRVNRLTHVPIRVDLRPGRQ